MNKPTNNWNIPEYKTFVDYINIIRNHLLMVTIISVVVFGISIAYAVTSKDIYQSSSTLRISPPEGNILDSPLLSEGFGSKADRFIANEIETMKNITIRKQVARVILDSFQVLNQKDKFSLILNSNYFNNKGETPKSEKAIAGMLSNIVKINQKKGLDFIEISAESPSPFESSLIVNVYDNVYKKFNLLNSRKQVTRVRKFLEQQKKEKRQDLLNAENKYKLYQLKGGAIQLDEQAKSLIETMSDLESQINSTSIQVAISKETLNQYKSQLKSKDASLSKFLDTKAAQPYLLQLQNQIAALETQRDYAISGDSVKKYNPQILSQYDSKLKSLKAKLKKSTEEYQASILAASPEEIKDLTQKIFEEEVKYNALVASNKKLTEHLQKYEKRFDALPERTIDLARLERERLSFEKLYITLEEKYQEALINEQSTSGNVLILNAASIPDVPAKPNRKRIILIGLLLGLALGVGYAVVMDTLDKSVKTPDDIEKLNIDLIGWIPKINGSGNSNEFPEFIVANKTDSVASDAYKSLRTMIKYTKVDQESKSFLITSSVPSEGKSLTALNLAGSFAQSRKRTVLLDCDLRKPRVHSMFNQKRVPGFTDYIVAKASYEEIIRDSGYEDLQFISAGTIPPNPTEILDSRGMKTFISRLKEDFDVIIIDSPPVATIADSVILSRIVDETIIVALADFTESEMLKKSVDTISKLENSTFSGVLLNRFNLRKSYGSYYYKYAYQYTRDGETRMNEEKKKRRHSKV